MNPLSDFLPWHVLDADGNEVRLTYISHIRDNLYQGGCSGSKVLLPERFSHVVNLCGVEFYNEILTVPRTSMVVDMADSYDQELNLVGPLATFVSMIPDNENVLIHCHMGINRSGLVMARVLMEKYGMSADQAIELLRRRRSPVVLSNDYFEQWLRSNPL